MLARIEDLEDDTNAISARIEEQIGPFESAVALLCTIPGVERRTAEVLIADRRRQERLPDAKASRSWAGVCPGQRESAGKRESARTRQGSPWLRAPP